MVMTALVYSKPAKELASLVLDIIKIFYTLTLVDPVNGGRTKLRGTYG